MTQPINWSATAYNPATESSNRIHSDEMAQAYGYRGALVPGVVISGYLMNPAVLAWGQDWLVDGSADIQILKPLYDGYEFEVQLKNAHQTGYDAELIDQEGTLCAIGKIRKTHDNPLPQFKGYPRLDTKKKLMDATPEEMQRLKDEGMHSLYLTWDDSHRFAQFLKDTTQQPAIHDIHGEGFAHGAFMLGITNWVLAGNAYMNPWVHLQTHSRFFRAVPLGTDLIAECEVTDLFSRKGHEFVDVTVNVFEAAKKQAVMNAELRAIYKMRPA